MAETRNRKGAEAYVLSYIKAILPGGQNVALYENLFKSMSDKAFGELMDKLASGEEILAVITPNLSEERVTVENNFRVAKRMGRSYFERIWIDPADGSPPYLTPEKYLVTLQPLRRQAQILVKKISIPENNRSINDLTGQPSHSGKSRGSKISYPETQILAALNLDNSLIEMIKYRGGDVQGFNAMNKSISASGGVSLRTLDALKTRVRSTDTLRTLLTCMHYEVDL